MLKNKDKNKENPGSAENEKRINKENNFLSSIVYKM
jgi:hypothetical protein